jgi:hypothetical protein
VNRYGFNWLLLLYICPHAGLFRRRTNELHIFILIPVVLLDPLLGDGLGGGAAAHLNVPAQNNLHTFLLFYYADINPNLYDFYLNLT